MRIVAALGVGLCSRQGVSLEAAWAFVAAQTLYFAPFALIAARQCVQVGDVLGCDCSIQINAACDLSSTSRLDAYPIELIPRAGGEVWVASAY
jgi:hypothetical protein